MMMERGEMNGMCGAPMRSRRVRASLGVRAPLEAFSGCISIVVGSAAQCMAVLSSGRAGRGSRAG
jgi:hypothetical protein